MTAGTRPIRHKLPLLHRLAWILILIHVETTNAASIVYPALQADTTAVTVNKNTTTKTIDMTPTTSPATTMLSTTKSPSDPVTKAAGGAEAATKNVAVRPVIENTTEYTIKSTSVLTTTTARPVKQVATVQSSTKLPSTQITTTSSTTAGPTVQVTESISDEATMKTNTERPITSVTEAANWTGKSTKSTTEAPFTKMNTNITKRPATLATTPKSTTERPVTQVTTLKRTTPHPGTQVTTTQTTTKLPSTQLTTIRSTTGLPSVQWNKTAVSEAGTMITTTSSPSVTVTNVATSQATTTHTSTARPSVQLTTMKSTSHVASTQATKKEGTTDHPSVPVTKTTSGSLSTTKGTTERPSTQGTTTKSATERPSVQVATTTSTTMSPSISVTEAVGGNMTTAKSPTERPSRPMTKPVSSEVPTMESTTELPSVQAAAAVGGGHITTTSTTQRPSTHVTKAVSDDATTSTTTTESSVIVDVILVTSPKPTASTKPPSHNLGDIVQEAVVVPQGSPVAEGGVDVVIEVVPILNGNETSGQDSVGLDTHSTFKPSSETTKKPNKMHSGLKKQFTNSYMQTYVTKRCGVPNERMRRIVGGKVTTLERYPWTVGVWMRYGQRPYCGGVIISWLFVLTAGHCTRNKVAHDLRVSFGLSEIDPDRVQSEQQDHLIAVAAIHQNPLFKDIVHGDDISILKMSKPLQSGGYPVTPICIPEATETKITTKDIVGTEGVVAGWGRTKYGGESSKQLREVWLPIVSNNACSAIFKDILKIRDEMICAGDINGTKDACQGDSGGSLMWRSKSDDRWYTLGVVSFGVKCAEPGYYGTYTRVQSYLDWICQVTDGLLCFGSSSYKGITLPTKDMREKQLRERRSRNFSKM